MASKKSKTKKDLKNLQPAQKVSVQKKETKTLKAPAAKKEVDAHEAELQGLRSEILARAKALRVEKSAAPVSLPPVLVFAFILAALGVFYVGLGGNLNALSTPTASTPTPPPEPATAATEPPAPPEPAPSPEPATTPTPATPVTQPTAEPVTQPTTPTPTPPSAKAASCEAMDQFKFASLSYDGKEIRLALVNNTERIITSVNVEFTSKGTVGGGSAAAGRWEPGSQQVFTTDNLKKNVAAGEYSVDVSIRAKDLVGASILDATACTGSL